MQMPKSFNPTEEYDIIRSMPAGQEKDKEKQKFHEKRVRQKTEIATIAALLIEEIIADPDLDVESLRKMVDEHSDEMELSGNQQKLFFKMLKAYEKRHKQIKKLQETSADPQEIFKKKFGFQPQKKVKVVFGPITTHFILSDEDYDKVAGQSKNDKGVVLRSGGQFNPRKEDITISRSYSNEVRVHEETHALKYFFDKIMGLERYGLSFYEKITKLKQELLQTKNPKTQEIIIEQILQAFIDENGDRIKDEIFANIRAAARNKNQIVQVLAKSAKDLGLYDYSINDRKELLTFMEKNLGFDGKLLAEEKIKGFGAKNREYIRQAVEAAMVLVEKHRFTPEMILVFLNDVPISLWKKETARLGK